MKWHHLARIEVWDQAIYPVNHPANTAFAKAQAEARRRLTAAIPELVLGEEGDELVCLPLLQLLDLITQALIIEPKEIHHG